MVRWCPKIFSTATTPCADATWANIALPVTSPIVMMSGTFAVRRCSSTSTSPRRPSAIPTCSNPIPWELNPRPTETKSFSVVIVVPSFNDSTSDLDDRSAFSTVVPVTTVTPRFFNSRSIVDEISSSSRWKEPQHQFKDSHLCTKTAVQRGKLANPPPHHREWQSGRDLCQVQYLLTGHDLPSG